MRSFKTPKGTELPLMDIKGKPYLSVQHRVMWFREICPDHTIETEFVYLKENEALAKATIRDSLGRILATAHKCEDRKGFADFIEKSESSAVGRALGFLGFGTQFALDLEEGERLADSPTNELTPKQSIEQYHKNLDTASVKITTETIPEESDDLIGSYVIEFGKYKGQTVEQAIRQNSQQKLLSYADWLEGDSRVKNKPLSDNVQDTIHAIRGYVESMEIPSDKNLDDKLNRLKNEFGVDESENLPF